MGENDTAPWTQKTEYQIPQLTWNNEDVYDTNKLTRSIEKGCILEHMGIPTTNKWTVAGGDEPQREISVSALPVRAYCLIWNEFFRSEALQNPVDVPKDDTNRTTISIGYSNFTGYSEEQINTQYAHRGAIKPLKVCKTFDYFTAALPEPQAGPAVTLPMNGTAPIVYNQERNSSSSSGTEHDFTDTGNETWLRAIKSGETTYPYYTYFYAKDDDNSLDMAFDDNSKYYSLAADLSNATGATINALRQAFAIQKFYEREARGGQRYIEMVRSHFNVVNPDFRLQRPEYLGGYRHQININQVVQTQASVEDQTPLGYTGAYSLTTHKDGDVFSHSFTEHGILMGLACIRQTSHTYQQGINRAWLKKDKFDFYTPEFANLGEQYIKNAEIYAQGIDKDKEAFGYQEAWAEMRYMPDIVSGEMRSDYALSEDVWHFADNYTELPTLGNKWIKETDANILRTLAVQDQDEFKCDFYFGAIYTRPLPTWSVPGLIDHH